MSLQNIRPFNDGFNRETLMTYVLTAGYNMLSGKWVTGTSLTYQVLIDLEFIHSLYRKNIRSFRKIIRSI